MGMRLMAPVRESSSSPEQTTGTGGRRVVNQRSHGSVPSGKCRASLESLKKYKIACRVGLCQPRGRAVQ